MKIEALVISMIILSLALKPCSDVSFISCAPLSSACTGQQSHSEGQDDGCTPFCVCNCCSVVMVVPDMSIPVVLEPKMNFKYEVHYSFSYDFDFVKGVWRPPALS